ncbi:MAG: hypothetical protein ACOCNX_00820 [Prevotella sp.]
MNGFIKKLLMQNGVYFTPESVIKKLRIEIHEQTTIKLEAPIANPPLQLRV